MEYHETIIIGAGPAGLQTGYFLDRLSKDYKILECGPSAGTFFTKYPLSRKLISFNKKYTGSSDKDFNLRFDWNSLLNDDGLLFTSYSDELFPDSRDLVRYLNDFAFGMIIDYNVDVCGIDKIEEYENQREYYTIYTNGNTYTCKYLMIATGVIPKKQSFPHYGDFNQESFTRTTEYDGKDVLIIGNGNSAYELANILLNKTKTLITLGKMIKLSSFTHYPGDLRGNYLSNLDLFSLKLLSVSAGRPHYILESHISKEGDKYVLDDYLFKYHDRNRFDHVIYCSGFCFDSSIFSFDVANDAKYPLMNHKYESINNKNLFFVGTLMHGLDKQVKSSGGFIHGFRYLIKYMIETVFTSYHITTFETKDELSEYIFHRINSCSSLYLMFNFMCDVVYFDGLRYVYIHDVTTKYLKTFDRTKYFTLKSLYGKEPETYDELYAVGFSVRANPKFLHFMFTFIDGHTQNEIKLEEDVLGLFDHEETFLTKIKRTMNVFA